jgi:hypothetical protein
MYQKTINILFQRKDKEGYYREHLENRGISVKLEVGNCFFNSSRYIGATKGGMCTTAKYQVLKLLTGCNMKKQSQALAYYICSA